MRLSFTAIHEISIACLISFGLFVIFVHSRFGNPLPDFSIYALRSSRTRLWHLTQPAVPQEVKDVEARLNADLNVMEQRIRRENGLSGNGKEPMPWNKAIWQSWKDEGLEEWRNTWKNDNPEWSYQLILDDHADEIIRATYAGVPDVLEVWNSVQRPVIKADLWRYLMIFAYGGLYTDVDTTSSIPLDNWITPEQWQDPKIHAIIGLSAVGFAEAFMELVQWTFVARPLSPLMRTALVTSITNIRRQQAQQGVELLSEVSWDFERVLKATGPVAFTDFCVRAVQKESKGTVNEPFFWGLLYDQKEPVQVGGVVVLPIKGGWRGSGGGGPDDYFRHHNQASWVPGIKEPARR